MSQDGSGTYYIYVSDLDNTNNASSSYVYIYNSTLSFSANTNSNNHFIFNINTTGDIRIINSEINSTNFETSKIELRGSDIWITNSTLWSGTKYTGEGCNYECNSEDLYSDLNIYGDDLEIVNSLLHSRTEATDLNNYYRSYHKSYNYIDISVSNFEITDSSLSTYSYSNYVNWGSNNRGVWSEIDIESSNFEVDNSTIMTEIGVPSDSNSGDLYPDFDITVDGDIEITDSFVGLEDWTDNYGDGNIDIRETNYTLNILDSTILRQKVILVESNDHLNPVIGPAAKVYPLNERMDLNEHAPFSVTYKHVDSDPLKAIIEFLSVTVLL